MSSLRLLLALFLATALAGCGFQLRGTQSGNLPYKSLYIALPETAEVRIWLERYIRASGNTEIAADAKSAEAIFQQLNDGRQKSILSVNAQGRVREYRLQMNYKFRLINPQGQVLVPSNEVSLYRDVSFDDSNVLAKDLEEGLLWRDMNNELVNQVMRRLSIVKPQDPNQETDD
jgi:LPS-assembly lipoprotein